MNFQLNGTSKLLVTNAGALTAAGLITSVGLNAGTGLIQGTGGLTIGGTTTLSSLNSAGIVHTNASGVLSTSAVALGTDTSGSYVNSLGTLTGLTASGNSGANSTPTLSVAYGSTANTAVQGNTSLVCASGSGNLSGGGNTITLGSGGTCSGLTMTSTPSFTSVTTASLTSSGALSLSSTGSNDLTLTSGSGTIVLGGSTVKNTGSLSHDLNGTGANTFTVTNSGTGTADVNIAKGGLQIAGTSILTSGKALQNLTGLTVASGGANITGGLTSAGTTTLSALSTAGVVHNNASGVLSTSAVALGTDTSGSYVANLGTLTGLSTTGNSGAGATPTLSVSYGSMANTAVQGNTTLTCASGSGNLSGGGNSITLGSGGTCSAISLVSSPTLSGTLAVQGSGGITVGVAGTTAGKLVLASAGTGSVTLQSVSQANAVTLNIPADTNTTDTICLQTLANCAGSGGISGTGTTNYVARFTGSSALGTGLLQDSNSAVYVSGSAGSGGGLFNVGTSNQFQISSAGAVTATGLTTSGTVTLSGLSSAGIVHTNASGVLSTSAVTLGTDTSGSYVANLGTLTGLSTTGNSGAGATPTLSVSYGSMANTAVQGNTTLTCSAGSGNLSGGGDIITLGSGGTCSGITLVSSPTFSGSLTSAGLSVAGLTTINTTGTADTSIGNNTGTFSLASSGLDISTSGALSGVTTLSMSGGISGVTTYAGSSDINTTGGSLQTNSLTRIDNSGNLTNIGNLNTTGASTFTAAGSNGFTFKAATDNTSVLAVKNSAGQNVLSVDTTGVTNNLVSNASIESAISGNWSAHSIGTGGTVTQDSTQAYYGSNSLKMTVGTGTTVGGAQQTLSTTLSANTQYNVFFYAKGNAAATVNPIIKAVYSVDGTTESLACTNTITLEYRTWQRYSCTFTTPASGITSSNAIFIEATTASQTFYVDGVMVQLSSTADPTYREGKVAIQGTISTPLIIQNSNADNTSALLVNNKDGGQIFNVDTGDYNNFVANPSFEVNTNGWSAVGTGASIARDTSQQKYGVASMKVVSGTAVSGGARYTLPTPLATGSYSVSFSMLTTVTDHSFIKVGYNNGTTDAFTTCSTTSPAASASQAANVWVRYVCANMSLTTPSSIIFDSSVANKTFYIDAVQVESGATASSYGLGQISFGGTVVTPLQLRPSTNATNAFQVQNTTGSNIFTVDTANASAIVTGTMSVSGAVTLSSTVTLSGAVTANSTITANGTLSVTGTTTTFLNLTLTNAHFKVTQTNLPTSITLGTCAGTPVLTTGSADSAGSFTTGSLTTGGACTATITFNKAFAAAPKSVILTPKTSTAPAMNAYVSSSTATTFVVTFTGSATTSTAYDFYYWVVE